MSEKECSEVSDGCQGEDGENKMIPDDELETASTTNAISDFPPRKGAQFYEDLVNRLSKDSIPAVKAACELPRHIQCKHCAFLASTSCTLKRHQLLKHFVRVEEDFNCFCPIRGCYFTCTNSSEVSEHVAREHPGKVKLKTIYHEELDFEDQSQGQPTASSKSAKKKPTGDDATKDLFFCQIEGCSYSFSSWKNFKVHYGKKHKQKEEEKATENLPMCENLPEKENNSESPANISQRSHREKKVKRKFMDEEWEVSRPKKPKMTKDVTSTDTSTPLKDLRIKLNPAIISFDPIQKALIEMTKVHSDLREEVSKIDGMMEKLLTEHCAGCHSCKALPQLSSFVAEEKISSINESARKDEKIRELESEISRLKENYRKMSGAKNSTKLCYKDLLGRRKKPFLLKKNEYTVVQGYRLIDLNVLRLAIQSAQKCGHSSLLFTEVNSSTSQNDLATQLGLLCSVCGLQTIFCTSSYSEEEPSNYSINKLLLPELGPYAYYSLTNFVQKSTGSCRVNINSTKGGVSVPHRAKLIVSMDRKSYDLDKDIIPPEEQEIVQPDLNGDYDNIAELDPNEEEAKSESPEEQGGASTLDPSIDTRAVNKPSVIMPNPSCQDKPKEPAGDTRADSEIDNLATQEDKSFTTPEISPLKIVTDEDSVSSIKIDSVTGGYEAVSCADGKPTSPVEARLKIKRIVDLQETETSTSSIVGNNHWTTIDGENEMEKRDVLCKKSKQPPLLNATTHTSDQVSEQDTVHGKVGNGTAGSSQALNEFRQTQPVTSETKKSDPGMISPNFKTPLQIFSIEVSRALKTKLPNLTNAQIQRIVIDKWSKMANSEKQVYRNKAKVLSTSLKQIESRAAPGSSSLNNGLPAGWRRTLVQSKSDVSSGKIEIVLHTPTGEKLRNRKELQEYKRLNNIQDISDKIFDFKKCTLLSNVTTNPSATANNSPKAFVKIQPDSVFSSDGPPSSSDPEHPVDSSSNTSKRAALVREVITTGNGMKMVRMMVKTSSGELKEALVPATQYANGALKVQLPRQYSQASGQQSNN